MRANIYRLVGLSMILFALSGCNQWLDLNPEDSTTEDELFGDGAGYRNALNGVYRQMSGTSMYGQEMSWGCVDVVGQSYSAGGRGGMSSTHAYYPLATKYNYASEKTKPKLEKIWSETYNSIANCNNLLKRIAVDDPSKFRGKKLEQDMIHGEALALRALLHFDMLRLFAPALVKDDGKTYIPYFENFPSLFEPNLTVKEILEKVQRDLKEAKMLVAPFDTLPEHQMWHATQFRYEAMRTSGSEFMPTDIFYTYRGYRMNYYAVCAVLARVYNYSGMHKEAYEETLNVIGGAYDGESYFGFTPSGNINDGDRKLYSDLIFALSNEKIYDIYQLVYMNMVSSSSVGGSAQFILPNYSTMFDDNSDYRQKYLTEKAGSYYVCNKYLKPISGGQLLQYAQDMIPMIRLSEMYYIQAEYFMNLGNTTDATKALDQVRMGRGCTIGKLQITDEASFQSELLKEARREFMSEGQLFFYYKKLGIRPGSQMTSDDMFVFPLPDNETIN